MKRWNPAACSTTLSPHVPTPRTFTPPRWEVERGSCILPSLGTGTKVAGLYCWHPCGEAAPREQPPGRPGAFAEGWGQYWWGTRCRSGSCRAASSLPALFPVLCSSPVKLSGETEKVGQKPTGISRRALSLAWGPISPRPALPTFPILREAARAPAPRLPAELWFLLHLLAPSGGRRPQ